MVSRTFSLPQRIKTSFRSLTGISLPLGVINRSGTFATLQRQLPKRGTTVLANFVPDSSLSGQIMISLNCSNQSKHSSIHRVLPSPRGMLTALANPLSIAAAQSNSPEQISNGALTLILFMLYNSGAVP